jgi:hypothetical protein
MEHKHHLQCEAPICQDDFNPNYKDEVLWFPGEKICKKPPYQKFQIKQIEINKLVKDGKFGNMDISYTANQLENDLI